MKKQLYLLLTVLLAWIQPGRVISETASLVAPDSSVGSPSNRSSSASWCADISPDGRFVLFSSLSDLIVTNDMNQAYDIFLRDRQTSNTILISSQDSNGLSGNGDSVNAIMSTDAVWVAFQSRAENLVSSDTNQAWDVFIKNTTNGVLKAVSVNTNGTQTANRGSSLLSMTPDGRFVLFESAASDLITNHLVGHTDLLFVMYSATRQRWSAFR